MDRLTSVEIAEGIIRLHSTWDGNGDFYYQLAQPYLTLHSYSAFAYSIRMWDYYALRNELIEFCQMVISENLI